MDREAPSGSVTIDNGALYSTSSDGDVSLSLSATDATSGVSLMRISVDGVFDDESDRKYETSFSPVRVSEASEDGLKTVSVKYRDAAGNESAVASDSVTLDQSAPVLFDVRIDDGSEYTSDVNVEVYLDSDGASEVFYLRALTRLRLGEPDAAEEDFRSAISKPVRRREVEAMARIGLANLAYERRFVGSAEKQAASRRLALEHYGKALELLDDRPPKAAVLYRLAVIEQELGDWEQARRHLSRIFRLIHNVEPFKKSTLEQPALRRFRATCFFIQAGVFKTRQNARRLLAKLRQAKLPARIEYAQTSPLLYSVRVGRYNTYAQALQHLPQVRRFVADAVIGPAP